jgi:hypothetical protein
MPVSYSFFCCDSHDEFFFTFLFSGMNANDLSASLAKLNLLDGLNDKVDKIGGEVDKIGGEVDKMRTEHDVLQKRVQFSPAVDVRKFNENRRFMTHSHFSLTAIVTETIKEFGLSDVLKPRFYVIPDDGFRVESRIVIKTEEEWNHLVTERIDDSNLSPIKLYFICDDSSPPPSLPITPPRAPVSDMFAKDASEPASCQSLDERDGRHCLLCDADTVENCHIVDKSRGELLFGIDDIDSTRNMVQFCSNHHVLFDRFQFTLVPCDDSKECCEFIVALTPLSCDKPSNTLSRYVGKKVSFSDKTTSPLPHLFLLKQLGRFKLRCPHCEKAFTPNGLPSHIVAKHKDEQNKKSDKRPLPAMCSCDDEFNNITALYDHMTSKHRDELYYHPFSSSSGSR